VAMEENGKPAPPEAVEGAALSFQGDRYTLRGGEESYDGTFKLDPGKTPRAIDTTYVEKEGGKKGKAVGIYKLEGNRLTICWRHGGRERPTEFATRAGSESRLIVV